MNLKLNSKLLLLAAAALNLAANVQAHDPKVHLAPDGAVPVDNEWIVVLKEPSDGRRRSRKLTEETVQAFATSIKGVKVGSVMSSSMQGFTAEMPVEAADELAKIEEIDYIEQSVQVSLEQQTDATWGIDRVDQRNLPLDQTYTVQGDGSDVYAYIIDTGVQITHNEFKNDAGESRATWGANTSGDRDDRDCNGHGTHVAGTVGGTIYGVAKNVKIVAVKVLTCSGSGSTAGVVAGVEWAMNDAVGKNATANLSLGGGASSAMNTAVKNLHQSGVPTVVAAGNSNRNACGFSPASEPTVITVGSTTSSDGRSGFSNFGNCVDIFAPGSGITAAWIGSDNAINTISGTSMASPHVCGGAALLLGNGIPAANVDSELYSRSTPDKVGNPGTGSPNKLLYVGPIGPTSPPTPAPPTPAPTPCTQKSITVDLTTDQYPVETSWTIKNTCNGGEEVVFSRGSYSAARTLHSDEKCVPAGEYEFTISDTYGDGICCSYGSGSYKVTYDGAEVAAGAQFTSSETKKFGSCVTEPTTPPTAVPTKEPTPTTSPTEPPTKEPTLPPTAAPTKAPTLPPTEAPTKAPKPNLAKNGTAEQSSTCYGGVASRGNDGDMNGRYWSRSVTHTCRNSNGSWWKVDLEGENAIIDEIIVWNREDCCSNRLSNSVIEILDRNGDVVASKTIVNANGQREISFDFGGVEGVEVRIRRPGNEFLSLAEVEVLGTITTLPPTPPTVAPTAAPTKTPRPNLAKNGTAEQSSTCYGGSASRGNDGNTNGRYWDRSVTHTCRRSGGSWWQVDLEGDNAIINEIVVWNREDCCSHRLTGSVVEILDREGDVVASNTIPTATNQRKFNIEFENIEGSVVRVRRPGNEFLSLAEVEVFGTVVTDAPTVSPAPTTSSPPTGTYSEVENLALEGQATQKCTGWGGVPSRAINGNNSPYWGSRSISHTCRSTGAWWQVELAESESLIEKIVVWNRLDCCSERLENSKVQVIDKDGTVVFVKPIGATRNIRTFDIPLETPVIGAIVKVTLDGTNYLQLSEVEVFGRNPL